nr:hypothetical protein I308_01301 [Cryptococcus tetragattii IND107]
MARAQIFEWPLDGSRERILSGDLINYITSTTAVAQVFSQLKAPEEFEHASLKGGIVLDDTWEALPGLFNAGVVAVGGKRYRRAMEKVRAENLLLELAKDDG